MKAVILSGGFGTRITEEAHLKPKPVEVDFIINDTIAIEVKAKGNITQRDLRRIIALKEEKKLAHYAVVSLEKRQRIVNGVHILPWEEFLTQIWKRYFYKTMI